MSERPSYTESELVELVQSIDVRAPEELHGRIQALVDERSARRGPGRAFAGQRTLALGLGGAVAVAAAAAVVLVASLSGAGTHALTLREASGLSLRASTMTAPGESPSNGRELAASVDGVAFPYWEEHFGWRASGARVDRVNGRRVRTVFYTNASGRRIGYSIIAGAPATSASGGTIAWREGTPFRFLKENGIWVVTWIRDGHRCVVSGRGMDWVTLLKLASWNDRAMAS